MCWTKFRSRYVGLLCALIFSAAGALCQSAVNSDLDVFVQDPSGAMVQGAQLILTQEETGTIRHAQSDASGHYHFTALPIGLYELSIQKSGFNSEVRKGMRLQVGQVATLNVQMSLASAQQNVVVTGDA